MSIPNGWDALNRICDAIGLPENARRVVIDIGIEEAPKVYVECSCDEAWLDVAIDLAKGVRVIKSAASAGDPTTKRGGENGPAPTDQRPPPPPAPPKPQWCRDPPTGKDGEG